MMSALWAHIALPATLIGQIALGIAAIVLGFFLMIPLGEWWHHWGPLE